MKHDKELKERLLDIIGWASSLEVNGPELLRRAELPTTDGFGSGRSDGGTPTSPCDVCEGKGTRAGSVCTGCSGSGRVSDAGLHSDPTAAAALTEGARDIVQRDAKAMLDNIRDAWKLLHNANGAEQHSRRPERASSGAGAGDCQCCHRYVPGGKDRLRKGYCDECRNAWKRAGYPDRFYFEQQRRTYLEEKRRKEAS